MHYGPKKPHFDDNMVVTAEKPILTWRQQLWCLWTFHIHPILMLTALILCLVITFR